jgi:hypothetical protein
MYRLHLPPYHPDIVVALNNIAVLTLKQFVAANKDADFSLAARHYILEAVSCARLLHNRTICRLAANATAAAESTPITDTDYVCDLAALIASKEDMYGHGKCIVTPSFILLTRVMLNLTLVLEHSEEIDGAISILEPLQAILLEASNLIRVDVSRYASDADISGTPTVSQNVLSIPKRPAVAETSEKSLLFCDMLNAVNTSGDSVHSAHNIWFCVEEIRWFDI